MEYELLDTDVTNIRDDAGIVEAQHFQTDEPILMVMGKLANGIDVEVESDYFAAIAVDRPLDEEEQAVHGEADLQFSSVLIADEDGMVAQESVVNVQAGEIDHAIEAFETVVEDGEIALYETQSMEFTVEAGDVVKNEPIAEAELEEELEDLEEEIEE